MQLVAPGQHSLKTGTGSSSQDLIVCPTSLRHDKFGQVQNGTRGILGGNHALTVKLYTLIFRATYQSLYFSNKMSFSDDDETPILEEAALAIAPPRTAINKVPSDLEINEDMSAAAASTTLKTKGSWSSNDDSIFVEDDNRTSTDVSETTQPPPGIVKEQVQNLEEKIATSTLPDTQEDQNEEKETPEVQKDSSPVLQADTVEVVQVDLKEEVEASEKQNDTDNHAMDHFSAVSVRQEGINDPQQSQSDNICEKGPTDVPDQQHIEDITNSLNNSAPDEQGESTPVDFLDDAHTETKAIDDKRPEEPKQVSSYFQTTSVAVGQAEDDAKIQNDDTSDTESVDLESPPDFHDVPVEESKPSEQPLKQSNKSSVLPNRNFMRWIVILGVIAIISTAAIVIVPILFFRDGSLWSSTESSSNGTKETGPQNPSKKNSKETAAPSASTPSPTLFTTDPPTFTPTTPSPTSTPTSAPTTTPQLETSELLTTIKSLITSPDNLQYSSTPEYQAYSWMTTSGNYAVEDVNKMVQRFALALLYHTFEENVITFKLNATADECDWFGVTCNETGIVEKIVWANQGLIGTLSPDIKLLGSLTYLDMAENGIYGQIPEELWTMTNLEHIFLHQNKLTGTLAEDVGNLQSLSRLFLSQNNISGLLPQSLGSSLNDTSRPLQWLSLSNNEFSGDLPSSWRLRNLLYMDLGFNKLQGTIPGNWTSRMSRLKHLYLDHNNLVGSLPTEFLSIGGGRLLLLELNNNQLTGEVTSDNFDGLMEVLYLHNNNFTSIGDKVCRQIVWDGGELASFQADCGACTCKYMCGDGECYKAPQPVQRAYIPASV
jgi:cytoskeletal protein RodZ